MAVRKFIIVCGQRNALDCADAQGWEDKHPFVSLRSPAHTPDQVQQFTGGAYSDSFTLPTTFSGGPQRDRLGDESYGSWQTVSVMGNAVQALRYLTPYNPAASYTNVGTGTATNYPGTGEVQSSPTPTGVTMALNVLWQKDPVGLKLTRRRNGVEHTIAAGWSATTSTVTVTPPMIPPPEAGEQFTYEIAAGAASASDDELVFCNQFGGLPDVGTILDTSAVTGAVELGKHGCTIGLAQTTGEACRIVMRTRPVTVGASVSFALSGEANGYTTALNGLMRGTYISSDLNTAFDVGDAIKFVEGNGTLPDNLDETTTFYVVFKNADRIEVSTTPYGAPLDVGDNFASGTTGPTAIAAPALPSEIVEDQIYYVTRVDSETRTVAVPGAATWTATANQIAIGSAGHGFVEGEEVIASGDVPTTLTDGGTYFVKVESATNFSLSATRNGEPLEWTDGGAATITSQESYFGFYISAARGGAEVTSTTGTENLPAASTVRCTVHEPYRGSLTGLQARCTSGTADNLHIARDLGDIVYSDGSSHAVVKCADNWPATPQSGDTFVIEVPTAVPLDQWAVWLPWCPFEGRAPHAGPLPATFTATGYDAQIEATLTGLPRPNVGESIRFYTSGTLPSPLVEGREYFVHSLVDATAFTVKATYSGTSAITLQA